jgi:hypothetical protein
MELYMVAVILKPTDKQKYDEGTGSKVIVQPVAIMAKDEAMAGAKALNMVPDEFAGVSEERLDVRVLSFRSVGVHVNR